MADNRNEKTQEPASNESGLADFLPDTSNGYIATAGTALANPVGEADLIAVEDALKSVHDPEIPVNIYDLGLIYDVDRQKNGNVYVTMSLTAPGCPVAGEMPGWVSDAINPVPGVKEVSVDLVWEPQWGMDMMSDEARLELGFM